MLSTMSTTNAAPAATNDAPWPLSGSTPMLSPPSVPSARNATSTADSVPKTRPTHPAVAVIRFQNMPRMKVANSGAVKNPNIVWGPHRLSEHGDGCCLLGMTWL